LTENNELNVDATSSIFFSANPFVESKAQVLQLIDNNLLFYLSMYQVIIDNGEHNITSFDNIVEVMNLYIQLQFKDFIKLKIRNVYDFEQRQSLDEDSKIDE
jgi:hypothetical protein